MLCQINPPLEYGVDCLCQTGNSDAPTKNARCRILPPTILPTQLGVWVIDCRVCGAALDDKIYSVKEMYFGTREEFDYQQCADCACLQLVDIPSDMGKYYPEDYYSKHIKKQPSQNRVLAALRQIKLDAVLGEQSFKSAILFFLRRPRLPPWVNDVNLSSNRRILDVGCGAGKLLLKLSKKGFRRLEGVDPFVDKSISYPCGVRITKAQIWDVAKDSDKCKGFDLVMMHHSLEHIPDQHRTFAAAADLLKAQGTLLIRVPLSSSWAWEHYRENWVQLDAPRHLYLHTLKSLEQLASKHGFTLESVNFDSTKFQFTGSEQYVKDIPLIEKEDSELFSEQALSNFERKAEILNGDGEGDQACFIFKLAA
jgi:SAM-dependent methyltransferase